MNTNSPVSKNKPNSKHKTLKFSTKWLTDPIKSKYVTGNKGDEVFTCKICQRKFKCESIYDHIKMHEKKQNSTALEPQKGLNLLALENAQRQKYEFEVSKFIFSNSLSFSLVEPLVELLKTLKKDDLIRQAHFSKIDRKRMGIIGKNCISNTIRKKIEKIMDNQFYHLIIDEASDGYGNSYLGINVRYLDEKLILKTTLYKLVHLEDDCSADKLTSILNKTVIISQKRKKNLISLITDGASTMAGPYTGVAAQIASSITHLFWLHCICHCLDLILEKSSSNVMGSIVQFVKEISSTFSFSNVNHSRLHNIQKDIGTKMKKILRFVPTRWLSLGQCLQRILDEWDSLYEFYY